MANRNDDQQPRQSPYQQRPVRYVTGNGYHPHQQTPRQLATLGQYFQRMNLPDQSTHPSQPPQFAYQQPPSFYYNPQQRRQDSNPAMTQHGPPLVPHLPVRQPPIYNYSLYPPPPRFYPYQTAAFHPTVAPALILQQQQQPGNPQPPPPQDPTAEIEQLGPLVQDPQPILSPSTTTIAPEAVAPSMYDSIIVRPRVFFDSQEVKEAMNILRMNVDIIYELRRKYHGNVRISTNPFKALSEKSSEFTIQDVTVYLLERVLQKAKYPCATFTRISLKKFLETYGIPESHRSFVKKFLMERDMKYWSYLLFMYIYFDLSPLPPKL